MGTLLIIVAFLAFIWFGLGNCEQKQEIIMQRKEKKDKYPCRVPTAKPTEWHKDKSRYTRKRKHKNDEA